SNTPHAGHGDEPSQRPKGWRGTDLRTDSARIRTLTEVNDLADALMRELLRRRFTATELKLFLFVLIETLNRCGRWVTVHGGIKSLAAQFVTHPEEVRNALATLTDQM